MAFWVPLLRPVLCCSGVSRALFVRPSLCGSVASASAAAAAGCSDRFGFTSRDGSVAAPGGAESLARFLRGVSAAACPVPAYGSGACSRVRWWRWFRLPAPVVLVVVPAPVSVLLPVPGVWPASVVSRFRLRLRCWRWFRLRFRLRVFSGFRPGPKSARLRAQKGRGGFSLRLLWASLISPGLCNQCPRAESCCM